MALKNGNQCSNNTTGMSKEVQGQEIECWIVGETENTEKSTYSSMVTVQLSDFNALLSFVVINKILKHIPKTNPS